MEAKTEAEERDRVLKEFEDLIKEIDRLQQQYEKLKDKLPDEERDRLAEFFE